MTFCTDGSKLAGRVGEVVFCKEEEVFCKEVFCKELSSHKFWLSDHYYVLQE